MNRFLILAFIWTVLIGCNYSSKPSQDLKVRKWYYDDGSIKRVQEYKDDSIQHGKYVYYYPNGIVADSALIVNNEFHGRRYLFYESGILHKLTTYKSGLYRSGNIYREDGSLEFYGAYNYNKNLKFAIYYDRFGLITNQQGPAIYSWVLEKKYPINKKFDIEILVADPPNCRTKITVINTLENKEYVFAPDGFNRVIYSLKQNPRSDIEILNVVEIQDTLRNYNIKDSLFFKINKEGYSSYIRM